MSFLPNIINILSSFEWFQSQPPPPEGPFVPEYDDVRRARALLRTLKLPMELVLDILDRARYWPSYEFKTDVNRYSNDNARFTATARYGRPAAATLCLDAAVFDNPIVDSIRAGKEMLKIKAIEFDIVSRDQGWTSENTTGTFSTSSWLEVSILRSETNSSTRMPGSRLVNTWISSPHDYHNNINTAGRGWFLAKRPEHARQGPQAGEGDFAWYLQGNRVASGREEYHVLWSENMSEGNEGAGKGEGFLQELKEGDRVIVWARAKVRILIQVFHCSYPWILS